MRSGEILIVEADKRRRLSRARALSREGYHVTTVSGAKEAARTVRGHTYKLVIVRAEEPEQLSMLLAQLPPEMNVLVTATQDAAGMAAAHSGTGIRSFLIEPFTISQLKDSVAQCLDRARLVKEGFGNRILTAIERTDHLPASEAEIDSFLRLVVEITAAHTDADYVSLSVKDEVTGNFEIKVQEGAYQAAWGRICQRLMQMDEPILLDDTSRNWPALYGLMTEAGVSALLWVPLVARGDVLGAINHIKVAKRAGFSPSDLNFASILGRQCSMTLENARLLSNVKRQQLHVQKLLHEISLAQENERKRLAIQIHDGVAQWMVGTSFGVRMCSVLLSESRFEDLALELNKISGTLQRSVRELRRAIADLRPLPLEEVGLVAALRQAAVALDEEDISCHTEIIGKLPRLTAAEENTTYWIVQEVLTNVRRHSRASDVSLRIQFHNSTISVDIRDNGQGFNMDEVMGSEIPLGHIGLLTMKERAELLGGHLSINSSPGKGTSIGFAFPVSSTVTEKTEVSR